MQPTSKPLMPDQESAEPVLEILENLVPAPLHAAAWAVCNGKGWYFGHGSSDQDWSRFWKMDLEGSAAFNAIWEHVRPRCEALAGAPLRVVRQYANGHTYGLGGNPHADDIRPGTFTLLYYPNLEWKDGWDGETVYYDDAGEIALAVRPRPNRAVFFDSRISHAGRAPSRLCPALRVTVAYKLEVVDGATFVAPTRPAAEPLEAPAGQPAPPKAPAVQPMEAREISRDGATHIYLVRVAADVVERGVQAQLAEMAKTVRLPGFRPGKMPASVLQDRYGVQSRAETLRRLGAEATARLLPNGSIAGSVELKTGAESGDLEFQILVTHLPDLPEIDLSATAFQRLTATEAVLEAHGITPDAAASHFRSHLKSQVLDRLDAACRFPMLPGMVEREFSVIWKAAQSQVEIPAEPEPRANMMAEFRAIAERRLRLGLVIGELARRYQIQSAGGADLEDKAIDYLLARARVQEIPAGEEELRQLAPVRTKD